MFNTVYELKEFYNSDFGIMYRDLVSARIASSWDNNDNLEVLGIGYTPPFHDVLSGKNTRIYHAMVASMGAHHVFDNNGKNIAFSCEEAELPLESNSVDRILVINGLEQFEMFTPCLQELWRILKSTGKILIFVPNRLSIWSRTDWTPLGYGRPFSSMQICKSMRDAHFCIDNYSNMLFAPPVKGLYKYVNLDVFEKFGKVICPALGGVCVIEASKHTYMPVKPSLSPARLKIRTKKTAVSGA